MGLIGRVFLIFTRVRVLFYSMFLTIAAIALLLGILLGYISEEDVQPTLYIATLLLVLGVLSSIVAYYQYKKLKWIKEERKKLDDNRKM